MTEFCLDCSKDLGAPEGWSDFKDMEAEVVLCEGCGYIQVDKDGRCKSPDCIIDHNTGRLRSEDLVSIQNKGLI